VHIYFKRFDEAEELYRQMDRLDLAIALRSRLGKHCPPPPIPAIPTRVMYCVLLTLLLTVSDRMHVAAG
jgi:hypothetical protein